LKGLDPSPVEEGGGRLQSRLPGEQDSGRKTTLTGVRGDEEQVNGRILIGQNRRKTVER